MHVHVYALPLVVLMATMFLSGMPGTMPSALACRTRPNEPSPAGGGGGRREGGKGGRGGGGGERGETTV